MSRDLDDVKKEYQSKTETEPTANGTILSLLANGQPYMFLVPRVTGDNDEILVVELSTNIPENEHQIVRTVLEATLATLPE